VNSQKNLKQNKNAQNIKQQNSVALLIQFCLKNNLQTGYLKRGPARPNNNQLSQEYKIHEVHSFMKYYLKNYTAKKTWPAVSKTWLGSRIPI